MDNESHSIANSKPLVKPFSKGMNNYVEVLQLTISLSPQIPWE